MRCCSFLPYRPPRVMLRGMAIRMKEWGMLAAPGQPAHVRTQGLYGWERVGRSVGEGVSAAILGGAQLSELGKVNRAGELADFSEQLRTISAEVSEELREAEVQDWDYSWKAAATPRIREAVQALSADSREAGMELARMYTAQASIEARRDRDIRRVSTARGRWEQRVEASISAGQEQQASRWLEAGRGVFVPEEQMPARREEVRSRACHARWEARLQSSPLEALAEMASAREKKEGGLPSRAAETRRLEQSCTRVRQSLRRELAQSFSACLHAGEDIEPETLELAARAGVLPEAAAAPAAVRGARAAVMTDADREAWYRWLDCREDGDEGEVSARLSIASAALPLEERRRLLRRLERTRGVPAADRRSLSNQLLALYHAGGLGCPGDAEARSSLLDMMDEGARLLAEQGVEAVSEWMEARRAGCDNWVCFEPEAS